MNEGEQDPNASTGQDEWSFEISGQVGAQCVTPPVDDGKPV